MGHIHIIAASACDDRRTVSRIRLLTTISQFLLIQTAYKYASRSLYDRVSFHFLPTSPDKTHVQVAVARRTEMEFADEFYSKHTHILSLAVFLLDLTRRRLLHYR
jgi:hypothetical protein